jgi:hypothetical protein
MLKFQGREILLQLLHMEEVSCESRLVAATFSADLLDDELRVHLYEESTDSQG